MVHGSDLLIRPKQCCSLKPAPAKAVVPTTNSEPSDPILLGTEVRMAYRLKSVQRLSVRARARSPALLITVLGVPAARDGSAALASIGRQVRCVAPERTPETHAGCEHESQPETKLHSFGPLTTGFEWVCTDSSWRGKDGVGQEQSKPTSSASSFWATDPMLHLLGPMLNA